MTTIRIAILLSAASALLRAQWLHYPTPGIPRTPDGKPNLTAPAPQTADGKPDLSGIWQGDQPGFASNLGLKPGDGILTPAGEALQKRDRSLRPCMPFSLPVLDGFALFPFKIIQTASEVVILHEHDNLFRQIFLDGRPLPNDPNPTWLGYSVGRWDGDVLVVETAGFNDRAVIPGGGPASDALHITERFRRDDFGHMEVRFTINDPNIYTKRYTFTRSYHLLLNTELLEYICLENEKDIKHMVDK